MAVVNDLSFIEKTMPGRVDKVFVKKSVTQMLLSQSEFKLDFTDNKIVKVYKTAATPTVPYKRGGHGLGANDEGAVQSTFEIFKIEPERWFSLPFDALDNIEDAGTVYGHQTQNYVDEHIVPETDTYRLSKLAGYTSLTMGNRISESITHTDASGILAKLTAAFKWFAERKVPESKQVIYVNPQIMSDIRISKELVRYLSQSEYKGDVDFTIERFMGREIVEVPSDMFYTDADYSGAGINPKSTSKLINFLVVDASATIPVERLNWNKIYDADQTDLGYKGKKYVGLINQDIFVLDNKKVGLYCSVSTDAATASANVLLVDVVADATANYSIMKEALTSPATIMWDKIGVYTASGTNPYTIGSSVTIGAGGLAEVAKISGGERTFTKFDSHSYTHCFFIAALDGKVVAMSKDFEDDLPYGA